MKSKNDLRQLLLNIDGKGYPTYKDIRGQYQFDGFVLSIDHVQGDPFAAPSKVRVIVPHEVTQIPTELFDTSFKRIAVCDFLSRLVFNNIKKHYDGVGGSGKSGLLTIDRCGQEILDRTSVVIDKSKLEARLEVGLPATGRRVLGRAANTIFQEALPQIVMNSLVYGRINQNALINQVNLSVDQQYIREELNKRGLLCFVANGSILPRESGVSQRPMKGSYIPFKSPDTLEVAMDLPNNGLIKGMGIPEGITLIAGGGYHGKSTLLNSLELGVYNHILGDGREYVITREDATKIRAEDGRRVEKVNISAFINNLPNNQDTRAFSTDNASGSTSQAANIIEALEAGTKLLLIDEDTSATNFMIRDSRMQKLVAKDKEPITPFIDRVSLLYDEYKVSTILVVGGSGDYFDVADLVIMMDEYVPIDVTERAKQIAELDNYKREVVKKDSFGSISERVILKSSFPVDQKGRKVSSKGLYHILYNKSQIDLGFLEQLISPSQTSCIATMLEYLVERVLDDKLTLKQAIDRVYEHINRNGIGGVALRGTYSGNLALPRKYEFMGAINRYLGLKAL